MCTKTPKNGMLRLILEGKKFESHQSRNSNSLSWRHFVLGTVVSFFKNGLIECDVETMSAVLFISIC